MVKQKTKQSLQALERTVIKDSASIIEKKSNQKQRGSNAKSMKIWIAISVLLMVIIASWFFGIIPWGVKYIECGNAPVVITSNFAGSRAERLYPGDKEYAPNLFNHYECMLPEENSGKRY